MPLDPTQVELAIFLVVTDPHPTIRTPDGLVLTMAGDRGEEKEIRDAIGKLEACGLFEFVGNAVAPTRAGLKARELLSP